MEKECTVFGCRFNKNGTCLATSDIPHQAQHGGLTDNSYNKYRNNTVWDACADQQALNAARQEGDKIRGNQ